MRCLHHSVAMNAISFLLFFFLVRLEDVRGVVALGFSCSATKTKCQSFVSFIPKNDTTVSVVADLFGLKSHTLLLGANGLPINTPKSHSIDALTNIRVPVRCRCFAGGLGYSDRLPKYTVAYGESVYDIAAVQFSGLVDFPAIAAVNNLSSSEEIYAGRVLWIPLPCSCDQGEAFPVAHYAHIVAPGSDLAGIAARFGTNQSELMQLNGISDPDTLQAGQVLDVPLRVCSSLIQNTSLDGTAVAVPDGSYELTAKNCVQCKCAISWQLDCVPNPVGKNISECPSMKCNGTDLSIGDSTPFRGRPCGEATVCSYAGYTNHTILTTLTAQSTCPTNSTSPIAAGASSSKTGGQCWCWPNLNCYVIVGMLLHWHLLRIGNSS